PAPGRPGSDPLPSRLHPLSSRRRPGVRARPPRAVSPGVSSSAVSGSARTVGARVARVEDPRLLTGKGAFVADVVLPGMLHACFVRSPFARARVVAVDASAALAHPGV